MHWILLKVRAVRKHKNLSQEQLAERIGVEQKTYSNWERGRSELTITNLERIAKALDVPVETFWDPKQFGSKEDFGNPDIQYVAAEPENVYENLPREKCLALVKQLRQEILELKDQNRALTYSINSLSTNR
ncbi:MAG: helix-turn-helix transcriptional regulator [Cyclobacteriaceae bacterium]